MRTDLVRHTHDNRSVRRRVVAGAAALTVALGAAACEPPTGSTTRVSVGRIGEQLDGPSGGPSITPDGRFVAFHSDADNLGDGAGNSTDVWVHDRRDGSVERASKPPGPDDPGGSSRDASISANGQRVAFSSTETNLRTAPDGNRGEEDVYVRDERRLIRLVSAAPDGTAADGGSAFPDISANGRFIAFESVATNLVDGDTNGVEDVFVHDLETGTTRRASLSRTGSQLSVPSSRAVTSGDGNRVAFLTSAALASADQDDDLDVYVKHLATGAVTFASIDGVGSDVASHLDMSDDGRFVAFVSTAPGGSPQTFVRDMETGDLTLISRRDGSRAASNGSSQRVAIARDATHVAFSSFASDLVAGDTNGAADYFVASRNGSGMARASVRSDGGQSEGHPGIPDVSGGGRDIAFTSNAADLVSADTNGASDVFVRDRG